MFSKNDSVPKEWGGVTLPDFLQIEFLQTYCQNHKKIKHLFIMSTNIRLYAHIFKLTFKKTNNYLQKNSLANIFLSWINFDVLYLTNSFITNVPAFIADKGINLKQLLNSIKDNYSLIVIPDFLFERMIVEDENYTKIEVEEEMVLRIKREWFGLEDYMLDLKKKYRNKIKNILKRTSNLEVRMLGVDDLEDYASPLQALFNQVAISSQFQGPEFNTDSFALFVKQGFMRVDGYFLDDKLVGFSSEIKSEENLYSYFVGFDKNLNQSIPIYGRILLENITSAISQKKDSLILGRTANEYKSNFGAIPIRSYIYLKVENKILRTILSPVYNKLRIQKWIQRSPFKNKNPLN